MRHCHATTTGTLAGIASSRHQAFYLLHCCVLKQHMYLVLRLASLKQRGL
jgi:hypothetical protein